MLHSTKRTSNPAPWRRKAPRRRSWTTSSKTKSSTRSSRRRISTTSTTTSTPTRSTLMSSTRMMSPASSPTTARSRRSMMRRDTMSRSWRMRTRLRRQMQSPRTTARTCQPPRARPPCDCDACLSDHECPEDEQEEEAEEEEEAVVDNGSEVSEEDVASCDCSECADALSDSEEEDDEQSEEDAADEPGTPESSKHDCQSAADDAYAAHLAAGGARDVLHEAQLATWRDDDIASLAAWKSMRKHARKSAQQQRTHEAEELSGDAEVEPNAGASVAQEDASVEAPSLDTPRMDTPSLNTSSLATPKPEVSETSCPAVAGVKRSLDDMENEESAAPEASGNSPASDNSEVVPQASATAAASDVAARPSKRARRIAAARNFAAGAAIGALGTFLGLARLGRSYE
ncbi:hypothetical protein FA09DRAFT_238967 [Tilletiopsis washingtonensis]|uniref:Uncharacterized protein n=1 Tax=Tilletiopsis washingtonensis TaxID=58919 RepID=A0A316ZBW6_9BASI|nr:hypothetical protein FA09DRAFT_238967 [Tilletiopsis washingtonensis]PWN99019.1 hypothetical protein FA09DRAFT_238967 [Tilletiopsis washingtonensis]